MTSDNPGPFAKKITELRDLAGLAKKEVPGISASLMQKIENENYIPGNSKLTKFAKAVGYDKTVQLDELRQLATD